MTRHEIASRIRKNAEEHFSNSPDLREMCAICSWALCEAFTRAGYPARVVFGKFDGFNHCWVHLKIVGHRTDVEELWDITLTQFGKKYPSVHRTVPDDWMYEELTKVLTLHDPLWDKWPCHQVPTAQSNNLLLQNIPEGCLM